MTAGPTHTIGASGSLGQPVVLARRAGGRPAGAVRRAPPVAVHRPAGA